MRPPRSERAAATGLALLAGLLALVTSFVVFPYHSINHDEAVYLQQAAMLLEGQLVLNPPVPESFRPWFFVRDGGALYSKYAPVPAAMFALGELVGNYRFALGGIAAAAVGLTYGVVAEAFDRRRGLLAAVLLLSSPLYLIQSSVFLPYLPTATLNLAFAFSYLRADRTGSGRWAAAAGAAIGLAFFARPYTATLFAAPFVVHASWTLHRAYRSSPARVRTTAARQTVTAVLGLACVALALGYNAVLTGSPFVFPYEAFAPLDGLGFGRRALLGYEITYTPRLAVRANAEVLWLFFARWIVAGPIGTLLAAIGVGTFLERVRRRRSPGDGRRLVLLGVAVAVVVGNCYFWGNLNVLGDLSDPTDGLVRHLGTYYHADLLLPTVAFAAHGAFWLVDRGRRVVVRYVPRERARAVGLVALVVSATAFGAFAVVVASVPVADNRAATAHLATAYEPFEERRLENAVVFVPTPFGDWLGHPFQALRNDPQFDGPVLYAVEERPFAVADAFPHRRLYRYSYRGIWAPPADRSVEPRLRPIRVVEGDRIELRTTLGVPANAERVSIRLATDDGAAYYVGNVSDRRLSVTTWIDDGAAGLDGAVVPSGRATVPAPDEGEITIEAFAERPDGGGVTYRLELPIEAGSSVRAISPYEEACLEPLRCQGEATYVPGSTPPNVFIETDLSAAEPA